MYERRNAVIALIKTVVTAPKESSFFYSGNAMMAIESFLKEGKRSKNRRTTKYIARVLTNVLYFNQKGDKLNWIESVVDNLFKAT